MRVDGSATPALAVCRLDYLRAIKRVGGLGGCLGAVRVDGLAVAWTLESTAVAVGALELVAVHVYLLVVRRTQYG